jgi:DNA-binding transcriptional LysR family regulator
MVSASKSDKSIVGIKHIHPMNLRSFDLNLLLVLDALLREGSTVKAGERVGLSQPAVSAALARLRHALGDPLFVRQGQGLVPTDFSRALAMPLRAELDRLEALLAPPAGFDPSAASMTFRIAGSDFFGEILMPALAAHLTATAPGVGLQLVDLVPDRYIDTLEMYEADMALIPDGDLPDWLEKRPLFRSPFVLVARRKHPALVQAGVAPGETLPLDLFCELPHILFSPQGKMTAQTDVALARIGRRRRVIMSLSTFSGVCRTVSSSELVAVVPLQFAQAVSEQLGLDLYPPSLPMPVPLIVAAWHRRSSASPAHRWMRGLVAEVLEPLDAPGQA